MTMSSQESDESLVIGHVYRLEGEGRFYIGSTTSSLHQRLADHRSTARKPVHYAVHRHFNEVGWDKARMILIRTMTTSIQDLRRAEGEVIRSVFDDPQCLNEIMAGLYETHQERFARLYPVERGLPTLCTCGDTVVQKSMKDHLVSERHLRDAILNKQPQSAEEALAEQMEPCLCGEQFLHRNKQIHEISYRHILKMRIKRCRTSDLRIPTPPILDPTPKDHDPTVTWCLCPCGLITRHKLFGQHQITLNHLQAMFDKGLIKEPQTVHATVQDTSIERASQIIECRCGDSIQIKSVWDHEQSKKHKANLRKLELLDHQEDVAEVEEIEDTEIRGIQEPACKLAAKQRIKCEDCNITITPAHMPGHKMTIKHRQRAERKLQGIPEPPLKKFLKSQIIDCPCGSKDRENWSSRT